MGRFALWQMIHFNRKGVNVLFVFSGVATGGGEGAWEAREKTLENIRGLFLKKHRNA